MRAVLPLSTASASKVSPESILHQYYTRSLTQHSAFFTQSSDAKSIPAEVIRFLSAGEIKNL
jgi:hypothetical protein